MLRISFSLLWIIDYFRIGLSGLHALSHVILYQCYGLGLLDLPLIGKETEAQIP